MSVSAEQWLDLREPADRRARNPSVADAMRSWFLQRPGLSVVDIAGGTGANLRALAPLLPDRQRWRLIEEDAGLLAKASARLCAWSDRYEVRGGVLHLTKGTARIEVRLVAAEPSRGLEAALRGGANFKPDLIAASACFERMPAAFIARFVRAADRAHAAVHATLIYSGQWGWTPRHPADREMLAAYHRFLMSDRGLGAAAGPTAAIELAEALTAQGFSVTEGASPWRLGVADGDLMAALAQKMAGGVSASGAVTQPDVDTWLARPRTAAEFGHVDLFAIPPTGKGASMDAADDAD